MFSFNPLQDAGCLQSMERVGSTPTAEQVYIISLIMYESNMFTGAGWFCHLNHIIRNIIMLFLINVTLYRCRATMSRKFKKICL